MELEEANYAVDYLGKSKINIYIMSKLVNLMYFVILTSNDVNYLPLNKNGTFATFNNENKKDNIRFTLNNENKIIFLIN